MAEYHWSEYLFLVRGVVISGLYVAIPCCDCGYQEVLMSSCLQSCCYMKMNAAISHNQLSLLKVRLT